MGMTIFCVFWNGLVWTIASVMWFVNDEPIPFWPKAVIAEYHCWLAQRCRVEAFHHQAGPVLVGNGSILGSLGAGTGDCVGAAVKVPDSRPGPLDRTVAETMSHEGRLHEKNRRGGSAVWGFLW